MLNLVGAWERPAGAPVGFAYWPDFLTVEAEAALLAELAPMDWDGRGAFRRRGQLVKRRELDFLQAYGRTSRRAAGPGAPLPPALAAVREQVAAAVGVSPDVVAQVIAASYRPGVGIDWHVDNVKTFGSPICGVSVGSACQFQLRSAERAAVWSLRVAPRSVYVLDGPARWEWAHRIPPVTATRYSVTLRAAMA